MTYMKLSVSSGNSQVLIYADVCQTLMKGGEKGPKKDHIFPNEITHNTYPHHWQNIISWSFILNVCLNGL